MLSFIAAAALALPQASDGLNRQIVEDLPRAVMESNIGAIWYAAFADESGTITDCRITAVYGGSEGTEQICGAILGKNVGPAQGPDGAPIAGYFRGNFSLAENVARTETVNLPADVRLTVETMPDGASSPLRLQVIALVDDEGYVSACSATGGASTELVDTLCSETSPLTMPVRTSASGDAQSYVAPLVFELVEERL